MSDKLVLSYRYKQRRSKKKYFFNKSWGIGSTKKNWFAINVEIRVVYTIYDHFVLRNLIFNYNLYKKL